MLTDTSALSLCQAYCTCAIQYHGLSQAYHLNDDDLSNQSCGILSPGCCATRVPQIRSWSARRRCFPSAPFFCLSDHGNRDVVSAGSAGLVDPSPPTLPPPTFTFFPKSCGDGAMVGQSFPAARDQQHEECRPHLSRSNRPTTDAQSLFAS